MPFVGGQIRRPWRSGAYRYAEEAASRAIGTAPCAQAKTTTRRGSRLRPGFWVRAAVR
ncbi:hypothetical protein ACIODT_13345 [Streptomyces sp. NPDC088251]|uniref:hypothetical protein n=1 Tax=unclassified Streptomyces TaxID=2593676 RepID=UPI0033C527EA